MKTNNHISGEQFDQLWNAAWSFNKDKTANNKERLDNAIRAFHKSIEN